MSAGLLRERATAFTQVATATSIGQILRETGADTTTATGTASTAHNQDNKFNRTCKTGNDNPQWKDSPGLLKRVSVDRHRRSGFKTKPHALELVVAAFGGKHPVLLVADLLKPGFARTGSVDRYRRFNDHPSGCDCRYFERPI